MRETAARRPRKPEERASEIARGKGAPRPPRRGCVGPTASVGELSQSLGLTVRAIRFYEELGLVVASRDRLGWRRYDREAQARLQLIAWLRQADSPLDEVSEILALDEAAARRRARAILHARRATLQLELERLSHIIDGLEEAERFCSGTSSRSFPENSLNS